MLRGSKESQYPPGSSSERHRAEIRKGNSSCQQIRSTMIDRNDRITTFDFIEMSCMVTRVNDAVERFAKGGYVEGEQYPSRWLELKKYLEASQERYHSANISGVKVTAGTLAGRIL